MPPSGGTLAANGRRDWSFFATIFLELTSPHQPRCLTISQSAVGCMRVLDGTAAYGTSNTPQLFWCSLSGP
jgi:hypothetical protein